MSTKPLTLGSGVTSGPPDTFGQPGGGVEVFSKDLGQLELGSVSLPKGHQNQHKSRFKLSKKSVFKK